MRLLIAEDDKALGQFLSRGLEADGYRIRLAYDGAAAVEAFRQEMPDLTILDLNLPVKDGEQVLSEVRALDADLPVLVLTGRQEVDTRVRCFDRGADDLMTKPFSLHELRARCRALLRRKRETRLQLRAGDLELDRLDHSASGVAVTGTSLAAGLGTMEDGALEASNVNISSEFSDLIVAQRAFEANAKSVTTFDTVTQDTINMVH